MDTFKLNAYGKINLGLDVVGRLENGYHQVRMVMQTIGIFDELTFTRRKEGIRITADSDEIPTNEHNLVYKAVRLMKETYNIAGGVEIHLKKRIPVAAGMAGGSSDAAAALRGVDRMYGLGLNQQELCRLGVQIGADVPYCIMGGTVLAEGIGEKLTPLAAAPDCYILLVKPDVSVSTRDVYTNFRLDKVKVHPDIDGMIQAVKEGSLSGITSRMENVLEQVTVSRYPVIRDIKDKMKEMGAMNSLMSGSGPTVFGIFCEEEGARKAYEGMRIQYKTYQIYLTKLWNIEFRE